MASQFSKGQRVRVAATKFDNENRDSEGMNFSERWLADRNGVWCYGTISRVYVKKGRKPQRYSGKYDTGGTMACEEEHIEIAGVEESDSGDSKHEDVGGAESDTENEDRHTGNGADEGGGSA